LTDIFPQKQQFSVSERIPTQLPLHMSHIIHSGTSSHIADSMALIVREIFSRTLSFDAGISYTMLMNDFHC